MKREEYQALQPEITAMRRALHQIPELGTELPMTRAYVCEKLDALGASYQLNPEDSGLVVTIDSGKPGKVFAIRADMDGLPVKEETDLPYKSENGCMHACGHDAHTAILLGVAKILLQNQDKFNGQIKLLFQTAEETAAGARAMIAAGAMENPRVDAVIGLHVGAIFPGAQLGHVGIFKGNLMASYDHFVVRVKGFGCHGSTPENSHDPIAAASQIISALQTIVSREIAATSPVVVSVCSIHGGFTYNVIPDEVVFEGTFRALTEEVRQRAASRIGEIAAGIASAMGCEAETEILWGAPAVFNEDAMTELVLEAARSILPEELIDTKLPKPVMGGEDFAYYLQKAPGTFISLCTHNKEKKTDFPHHNCRFDVDEEVLWEGCAVMVESALKFLNA